MLHHKVGPYSSMTGVLIKEGHIKRHIHGRRMCEDEGRDGHASASQRMPVCKQTTRSRERDTEQTVPHIPQKEPALLSSDLQTPKL